MADLETFEKELRGEHAALTKAYDEAHAAAEAAWAKYETIKAKIVAFRQRYGHVIKALDRKLVQVTPAAPAEGKK